MKMYDLIVKKKRGEALTGDEIRWMIRRYTDGVIPDYQMSAMMMAICFVGMTDEETKDLTLAMAHSGDILDLSAINGIKVDKHSTGGVGDKTSLVLAPLAASVGVPVAKMSGRGLGHTGGTIDKLESFTGFSTALTEEQFIGNVNKYHIAIAGQTADLAPADKKLYALRDVTGTVDQMSLIASSIMSKKLASGADAIVLDVKTG
ncbi:MAG TPA: thymidine phosphorylase, partial [Candidatus Mediterraneibacter colneyensis]|nr:thymidine phosphorylase [Candidatus Mediterraneibacter colneyensis]